MDGKQSLSIGERLRRRRRAAGLSQEELARRAGLSAKAVSAIERGERRSPHPHTRRALADALNLSDDEHAAFIALPSARIGSFTTLGGIGRATVLPVPLTPLVGRAREVAALSRALLEEDTRLLTLTGAGGVGKTRLAVAAAEGVAESFADGVVFVGLASIEDPGLVVDTISRTLGLKEAGGLSLTDALRAELRAKRALLVLDNFEHVIGAAPEIAALLSACPGLRVLVTSREALRLRGERQFPVPPLEVPDLTRVPTPEEVAAAAAVELFVRRAGEVAPTFELTQANATAVAAICRRLDGLPLAIELAAALAKLLSPRALLARLDSMLPLLVGGARDLPERQRTMRRAVAWSYDLLAEHEQSAFRGLSIFAGSCTLEAAEAVCGAASAAEDTILEVLSSLAYKSLLIPYAAGSATPDARDEDEVRFGMLQTIRDYGLEQLKASGEEELNRARHARFYLDLAEMAAPELYGPGREPWLELLESEHDNLRTALRWAAEAGQTEMGLRMVVALLWFWFHRGHWGEGRGWHEDALARAGSSTETSLRARALYGAGMLACFQGERASAHPLLEESAAMFRSLGDERGLVPVLHLLSLEVLHRGDAARARELSEESVALAREHGDDLELAGSLSALGMVAEAQEDYATARPAFEECVAVCRRLKDYWLLALPLRELGVVAFRQGDHDQAESLLKESLLLLEGTKEKWFTLRSLEALAMVAAARGDHLRAARLHGAGEAFQEEVGSSPLPHENAGHDPSIYATTHGGPDEQSFGAAWAEGRAMTAEQAISYALTGESVLRE